MALARWVWRCVVRGAREVRGVLRERMRWAVSWVLPMLRRGIGVMGVWWWLRLRGARG